MLEAQGQAAVSPADRQGLHPLLIPLAQQGGSGNAGELTCLLRWPEGHKGMELPVVSQARGGTQVGGRGRATPCRAGPCAGLQRALASRAGLKRLHDVAAQPMFLPLCMLCVVQVRLLARSLDEYLHRALAEEEAGGGGSAVAQAAGGDAAELYQPGAFAASGLPTLDAYLTRKVGGHGQILLRAMSCTFPTPLNTPIVPVVPWMFAPQAGMYPDVAERLALAHLAKGDQMSALITGESAWPALHCGMRGCSMHVGCDCSYCCVRSKCNNPSIPLLLALPPCCRRVVHAEQPLPWLGPAVRVQQPAHGTRGPGRGGARCGEAGRGGARGSSHAPKQSFAQNTLHCVFSCASLSAAFDLSFCAPAPAPLHTGAAVAAHAVVVLC